MNETKSCTINDNYNYMDLVIYMWAFLFCTRYFILIVYVSKVVYC